MKEETEKEIKSERDASMNSSLNSTGSSTSNDNMWVGRARVEYQDMKRLRKIDMENSFHEKRNRNLERIKEQNAIRRRSDITGIHPGQIQRKRSFKMREDVKEAVFRDVLKANSNNFVCRLKPYILPPCVGLPFSLRWLPTNSNIAADDGKGLQHIPYINDQVIEKEMSFIEELIELNGNSNTNFKVVQDEEKIDLLKRLYRVERKQSKHKIREPSEDVFHAVERVLGSDAESLKELFHRERAKSKGIEPTDDLSNLAPSVDDTVATWTGDQRENILSSFRQLICPRCFRYDCKTHTFQYRPPTEHYELCRKLDMPKLPFDPCSEDCFLHVTELRDHIDRIFRKKNKKTRNEESELFLQNFKKENLNPTPWTDSDQILIKRMRQIYKGNFCAMAKCLFSKTCLQVCHYCITVGLNMDSGFDTENAEWLIVSTSPPAKRKPNSVLKNMRKKTLKTKDQVNTHNFEPCDHPGEMCGARCPCLSIGNFCEKFCVCNRDCANRFPGCSCRAGCSTKACPCFAARRECDPDICKTCGADNFKATCDDLGDHRTCQNVKIQRGQRKHLLMAPSDIAGWGIYIKDSVSKGDFISEYCGELISQEEGDRRGRLYDKFKCSFLFDLNSHYCIDATKKGNKIRFANHSMQPNCDARVLRVNGDHRIGIFAKKDIQRGEELFFDYRYNQTDSLKYVALERGKST